MTMKTQLSPKDLILLSSYLDDELDPREKARVEARLQAQPALRDALESLQRTKVVLRRAPARRVPHNFTLPASMARTKPARAFRVVPGLLWSSAAVAIVSILFVVGTLVSTQIFGARMAAAPRDLTSNQPELEAPAAQATQAPPIVVWGGATGQGGATGSGGAAEGTGIGGGAGAGGSGQFIIYPTQPPSILKAAPVGTATSEFGLPPEAATPTPEATIPPPTSAPLTGSGPILGVAPTEQQGEILPETNRQLLPVVAAADTQRGTQTQILPLLAWIGIGLFVLAVGLFLAAVILRRKAPR